ncbi:uncharacterized protein [Centruroides vittatus]|uniref:uncharacterized protein n=1 Tax=Centruroides vittatus TaxID=120091 RepID=UPI00350F0C63
MAESQSPSSSTVIQNEIFEVIMQLLGTPAGSKDFLGHKIRGLYTTWIQLPNEHRKGLDKRLRDGLQPSQLSSYESWTAAFATWENLQSASSTDTQSSKWKNDFFLIQMSEKCEAELLNLISIIQIFMSAYCKFEMKEK